MWLCAACGHPLGRFKDYNLFLNLDHIEICIMDEDVTLYYCVRCMAANEIDEAYCNRYGTDMAAMFATEEYKALWRTFSIYDMTDEEYARLMLYLEDDECEE